MPFKRHIVAGVAALRGERRRTGDSQGSSAADTDNGNTTAGGEPRQYRDGHAQQREGLREALPEGQKSMTQRACFGTFLAGWRAAIQHVPTRGLCPLS